MATTNLGRVSVVPKGTWNSATNYTKLDIVTLNGSSYIALVDNSNKQVTNTSFWQLIAKKGDTGDTGETGETGATGATGNGIASIEKTDTTGLVDTYTITYTNGDTFDFTVTNGEVSQAQLDESNRRIAYNEKYSNCLLKETKQGVTLSIDDTLECPMGIELNPSALEQGGTTGKQLFNKNAEYDYSNASASNWQITPLETGIRIRTFTSSTTPFIHYTLKDLTNYIGKTVRLKSNFAISGDRIGRIMIGLCESDGTNRSTEATLNTSGNTVSFVVPQLIGTQTYLGMNFYINSSEGSTTSDYIDYTDLIVTIDNDDMSYEKFTGGDPAPNPNYLENIHTVTGDNTIKVMNKNMFNKNTATYSNDYYRNDSGAIVSSEGSGYVTSYIEVNPNTTYIINGTLATLNKSMRLYYLDKSKGWISRTNGIAPNSIPYKFTTPSNCYYMQFQYATSVYDANTIQIELGSTASTYVEHQEQSLPLTLDTLEYCKIGTYADEFYLATASDTSLVAGKWYLKKNIGKWQIPSNTGGYNSASNWYYVSITNFDNLYGSNNGTLVCNYYVNTDISVDTYVNGIKVNPTHILTRNNEFNSQEQYRTYYQNNNVIFYGRLSNSTYTLLNDTLQEQLTEIYKWALSYQGQTNIIQINADLPFVINATIVKDLNEVIATITNAIIEIGGE